MPRSARIVAVGFPHHITQRGNNKQITFIDDEDYTKYLFLLEKYKNKYHLDIYSYSLITNHIHVKAIPNEIYSLAKVFNLCQMCYAKYFNKKYKKVGHLWQSRFFSCPLDTAHLYNVTKYIENNPVKANLVESPADWPWSSAGDHLGTRKGLISLAPIEKILKVDNWNSYLSQSLPGSTTNTIEKHLYSGKPLGDEKFIETLKNLFGLSLNYAPKGRPLME